jgi:hypothetical protein
MDLTSSRSYCDVCGLARTIVKSSNCVLLSGGRIVGCYSERSRLTSGGHRDAIRDKRYRTSSPQRDHDATGGCCRT